MEGEARLLKDTGDTHSEFAQLIEQVSSLDPRHFEESHRDVTPLVDTTRACLDQALSLLSSVLSGELPVPAPESNNTSEDDLLDLVFVSHIGMLTALSELDNARNADRWTQLGRCDGARRELLRGLCTVGNSIASRLGRDPYSTFLHDEARQAIETRFAFVRFLHDVNQAEVLPGVDPYPCIRRLAASIAYLVGRPCYPTFRIGDRRLLREVQARLLEWAQHNHGSSNKNEIEARRLWQDVANLAVFLMSVNQRPELREHDRRMLSKALRVLESEPEENAVQIVQGILVDLEGRDTELDSIVKAKNRFDPQVWANIISQTLRRLEGFQVDYKTVSSWAAPPSSRRLKITFPKN